ncbi:hypothetical protein MASR2M18_11320 [Ignavibacteria bacterium]
MKRQSLPDVATVREFRGRLDIYWQSTAVYAVALVMYSLLKGVIEAGRVSLAIYDPIVMLLFGFVLISAVALCIRRYMRPVIVITSDCLIVRNHLREKRLPYSEITRIAFGRGGRSRLARYRIIKIKMSNRRRAIRIRPSLFENDRELMTAVADLKRRLGKSPIA